MFPQLIIRDYLTFEKYLTGLNDLRMGNSFAFSTKLQNSKLALLELLHKQFLEINYS